MSNEGQKTCCQWFMNLICGSEEEVQNGQQTPQDIQPNQQININIENEPNNDFQIQNNLLLNNGDQIVLNEEKQTKIIINSVIEEKDIITSNSYDKLKLTIYNCPICFRYFNYILKSKCCSNYLCYFCVNALKDTSLKYSRELKCPICNHNKEIEFNDVNPGSPVKYYTDSANVSIKKEFRKETQISTIKKENIFELNLKQVNNEDVKREIPETNIIRVNKNGTKRTSSNINKGRMEIVKEQNEEIKESEMTKNDNLPLGNSHNEIQFTEKLDQSNLRMK